MDTQKLQFVTKGCLPLFKNITADATGNWGIMNAQQMVEHVAVFFDVSTEKIKFPLVTPVEHLPKYKEFLLSDKEFRENTKAPITVIGEKKTLHPVFGELNFEEWVLLHYKHVGHHLKQFGMVV